MAVNKVMFDGDALIDLTSTTAIASDVASGKLFFGKDGVLTTGTASGGGSTGLEYETGTYTTSSNVAQPTISFTNTHTSAPAFVAFFDATGTAYATTKSNMSWTYVDNYKLFGGGISVDSTNNTYYYAIVNYYYRNTSTSSLTSGIMPCSHTSSETGSSTNAYPKYHATNTGFRPYTNSTSRYWRKDRTYKWIAIWK